MLTNETNAATKNKQTVDGAHFNVLLSFLPEKQKKYFVINCYPQYANQKLIKLIDISHNKYLVKQPE